MSEYQYTTADVAKKFDVDKKTVRKWAAPLRLGIDLGGRAGYRYSDEDIRRMVESLKPEAPAPRKRKATRRAA